MDLHRGMSNATWEPMVSENWNDTSKAPIFKLHFPSCSLDYLEDVEQSRTCLRNRHVVLIGDSLTRYMYLNLVNYLETGEWIPWEHPYSEAEKQWGSWTEFYEVRTQGFLRRNQCRASRPLLTNKIGLCRAPTPACMATSTATAFDKMGSPTRQFLRTGTISIGNTTFV